MPASIALFSTGARAASLATRPPRPRPFPNAPSLTPATRRILTPPNAQGVSRVPTTVTSGSWVELNNEPVFAPNGIFLLTDGRILVQDGTLTDVAWWTLTPDNTGSYVNGTWAQVASPGACPNGYSGASSDTVYSPLYYGSAILPDGRFVMIGGEYNYDYDYVLDDGSGEVWSDQGAIYDPVANTWTCITAPSAWNTIGDAESVVLPNGTFMIAHPFSYTAGVGAFDANDVATLNASSNPPTFNSPFTPGGKSADPTNDEEGWTLLPSGTVLTLELWNAHESSNTPALSFSPTSDNWSGAGTAPDPLDDVALHEIGPAALRPDGTVFAEGATGFNDIYNSGTGKWTSGPSFPTFADSSCGGNTEQPVAADAPSAVLPDGNVLVAASPLDTICGSASNPYVPPTNFYEFDGANLTQVNAPGFAGFDVSYVGRLLVLPTGQVLWTDYNDAEIYTPAGTPNSSWMPSISSAPSSVTAGGTNYSLSGKQLNGLTQANYYGDDYQAATNFPLVRITNNATGDVFYARTHGFSSMGVATGSTTVSTEFDVPVSIETGASSLVVVANGIASSTVSVTVLSASPTPTATATATRTATATPTATPSPSGTPTSTPTSSSGTPTPTLTATATLTATPTPTMTGTGSPTTTASFSATPTSTTSPSPTTGGTPTATATATTTATATGSVTPTMTPTQTMTPTPTATPTNVPDVLEVNPSPKNFGNVKLGKAKMATFTLKNTAKTGPPITFATTPFSVTDSQQQFQVPADLTTCTQTLLPKKKCKLKVEFAPAGAGAQSSTLTIFDNAANANQTVQLSGTGK